MTKYRELIKEYKNKKRNIKRRLKEFRNIHKGKESKIFSELCFCILTPQSNAVSCDCAMKELVKTGLLLKGSVNEIRNVLKSKTRFHNKKADYIILARGSLDKNVLRSKDNLVIRDWLVRNIKGMGYKEASHFLRNIGLGRDIAILDSHILKNLKKYGVINKIPSSLTPKAYCNIEDKARLFSNKINIPLAELDLLFWSKETGEIFK